MKPRALFIVTTDPRVSPRPAEAVRIAAGIGTWEKVNVNVYLRDAAVLALGEFADELTDGENFNRYLPLLAKEDHSIFVQRGAPLLTEMGEGRLRFREIDDQELANHAAECNFLLRF